MFRKGVEGRSINQSFKDRHQWKTLVIPTQISDRQCCIHVNDGVSE